MQPVMLYFTHDLSINLELLLSRSWYGQAAFIFSLKFLQAAPVLAF